MIRFVNAKLNLGLNIVRRREDGYHDLQTVFYPVGKYNGTPENPEPFCDIIEITPAPETEFILTGRPVNCPLEKNLVFKAWKLFKSCYENCGASSSGQPERFFPDFSVRLEKHLPDGAGLGGGSADATFVLLILNELTGFPFSESRLADMALQLGADCPFFVYNTPCYAEGVGEKMQTLDLDLKGWWCVLVKPEVSISTKEAFAGVTPLMPSVNLKEIVGYPVDLWQDKMRNDFEDSLFPNHPVLDEIKSGLLKLGASYAAMSGSGSTVFGLFPDRNLAQTAISRFPHCYTALCML